MSATNHANKCKKVYEVEQELRDDGWFVFRRTSPHGLFHIIGFKAGKTILVQVARLHSWSDKSFNQEMCKVQEFAQDEIVRPDTIIHLYFWVNNRGWKKFYVDSEGNYIQFEDYGAFHYRMKKNTTEKV